MYTVYLKTFTTLVIGVICTNLANHGAPVTCKKTTLLYLRLAMYCDLQGPSRSHRTHVLQRCHGSKEVDALVEGTICRNILVEKNRFPAMFPENQSKYIS